VSDPLSEKRLLSILEKNALLSFQQARDIYVNRLDLVKQAQRRREKAGLPEFTGKRGWFYQFIDTIVSLNLKRKDDPSKALDEDTIYQCLAESWKIPFVKIDPLNLDLNIVTTTIPISFAKNHLVLPINISQGELTVATPDPFNLEVLEDIGRACQMPVNAVVSP
jgi:general secretion pathway protein E